MLLCYTVNLRDSAAVLEKIMSNFLGLQFQAHWTYVIVLIVKYIWPFMYKKGARKVCLHKIKQMKLGLSVNTPQKSLGPYLTLHQLLLVDM